MTDELLYAMFDYWGCRNFTKSQAKKLYEEFIGKINFYVKNLEYCIELDKDDILLDYTPDSLIYLWEWFEQYIVFDKQTPEEHAIELNNYPEWMHDYVDDNIVSYRTLKLAMDVSVYFGEVFIKNNNRLKWDYFVKPKSMASVNQPVIMGFKHNIPLNPRMIVYVCMSRSYEEGFDNRRLYNAYIKWKNNVVD